MKVIEEKAVSLMVRGISPKVVVLGSEVKQDFNKEIDMNLYIANATSKDTIGDIKKRNIDVSSINIGGNELQIIAGYPGQIEVYGK